MQVVITAVGTAVLQVVGLKRRRRLEWIITVLEARRRRRYCGALGNDRQGAGIKQIPPSQIFPQRREIPKPKVQMGRRPIWKLMPWNEAIDRPIERR